MGRSSAFLRVLFAYLVALVVAEWALFTFELPRTWGLLWADVLATFVIFGFSVFYRNASFYDPYWSVVPPLIAGAWWFDGDAPTLRAVLVLVLVGLWAYRLTRNWALGWSGLEHEDWRYVMLREQLGFAYPAVNLFGIHLFPTIQVFMGCLALGPALGWGTRPIGPLDIAGAVVGFSAVGINHLADEQLRSFRATAKPDDVLTSGIWGWSRHPNYLGEMGFWWGLWLFALAADPWSWWTGIGALSISAMFVWISIPMIERRMLEKRPHYARVIRRIPCVIPRPPEASS